jgi:biopolymer transport protein ExbD
MAVSVGPSSGDADVLLDVNTTPLIDVMLVLLVMLIITIPIQTHAVKLDMPQPTPDDPNKPKPPIVQIDVDFDHSIYWNNLPVTRVQLDSYLYQAGQLSVDEQPELHIRPNRNAIYGDVALVMADAQRNHVLKIGLIGYEQFPEYF